MSPVWVITKKELSGYFNSLIGYLILTIFLVFIGAFTWLIGNDVFIRQQATLEEFFGWAPLFLLFMIPALTMKQLAEEKKTGTIELLLTKNVTDRQLVLGKFLACFLLVCITIAFTLPYYVTISQLGNADHGAILGGYLGLLLLSAAFTSIGIFASSLQDNQIVAFLLALVINFCFLFLLGFLANSFSGWFADFLNTLSIPEHYDSLSRGVLDTKDLVYFGSLVFLFLLLAELQVRKRG